MDYRLVLVLFFTGVIHLVNTMAYSVRLAGVRTRRLAMAFSLWNVIFLLSSTANTIQAPLFGNILDDNIRMMTHGNMKLDMQALAALPSYGVTLGHIEGLIRTILLSATVGTILGTILIPSFVKIFSQGILAFERVGSVPRLFMMALHPARFKGLVTQLHIPKVATVKRVAAKGVPRRLMLLNVIITGIYTTGILSSMYAGAINPRFSMTAVTLASIINGVATVLLATLVDPQVASITDQALRGERSEEDVKTLSMYLAFSRIAGTLMAQVFFIPAAHVIVFIAAQL